MKQIKTKIGDLFASDAQTLVNTVNCVGVMGKGVALEFKNRFPDMYDDYAARCKVHAVRLGQPYVYRRLLPPWILNFPTKDHWRSVSNLGDIIRGLVYLKTHYEEWGITSLAVPPLGCGQGGLEWRVVGPTLYRHLAALNVPVELYAPHGTPAAELEDSFLAGELPVGVDQSPIRDRTEGTSRIPPAWLALVEIIDRIDREPYHWPVGRTSFQKIAYFATECGIPTGLTFRRGSYGPFSADLKAMETKLVNNGLLRENKLGRMLHVDVGSTYADAKRAFEPELRQWESIIEKISDLFLRMATHQAEIAATVHFAAHGVNGSAQNRPTERQVFDEVLRWKQKRRPPLREEEVAKTVRNLNLLRWLDLKISGDLPLPQEEMAEA